jgi:hypothetical protein
MTFSLILQRGEPEGQEKDCCHSDARSVVPSDPDTAQDEKDYESEGIIPDPVHKPKEEVQSMKDKFRSKLQATCRNPARKRKK